MITNQYIVTTTRSKVLVEAPIERTIYLHILGAGTVYIGGADVTAANGFLTEKNAVPLQLLIPPHQELWAVADSGTEDLRILRTSADGN